MGFEPGQQSKPASEAVGGRQVADHRFELVPPAPGEMHLLGPSEREDHLLDRLLGEIDRVAMASLEKQSRSVQRVAGQPYVAAMSRSVDTEPSRGVWKHRDRGSMAVDAYGNDTGMARAGALQRPRERDDGGQSGEANVQKNGMSAAGCAGRLFFGLTSPSF